MWLAEAGRRAAPGMDLESRSRGRGEPGEQDAHGDHPDPPPTDETGPALKILLEVAHGRRRDAAVRSRRGEQARPCAGRGAGAARRPTNRRRHLLRPRRRRHDPDARCASTPAPACPSSRSTSARSGSSRRSIANRPAHGFEQAPPGNSMCYPLPGIRLHGRPAMAGDERRLDPPSAGSARGRIWRTRSVTMRSGGCAATGWSSRRPPGRPATTSPTAGRSWRGGSRGSWSRSSRRTR